MGESGATGKKSVSHKLPGEKRKTGPWLGKLFLQSFAGAPKDFEGGCGGKPVPGNLESLFSFCLSFFLSGFVIFYVEFLFYFFHYRKSFLRWRSKPVVSTFLSLQFTGRFEFGLSFNCSLAGLSPLVLRTNEYIRQL